MSPGCKHPCAVEEADLSAQLPSVLVKSFSHSPAPSALTELTSAFIAYKLEVSLHPPRAEPAGPTNPISTAYFSSTKSDCWPVHNLPLLYNLCNSHIPVIHWILHQAATSVVKEQAKIGWDDCSQAAGDGGSSWHPFSAATSPHPLKRQNLHHDTLSVRRLIYSTCY